MLHVRNLILAAPLLFFTGACMPLTTPVAEHVAPSDLPSGPSVERQTNEESPPLPTAVVISPEAVGEGAQATVVIRSLRVRREPVEGSVVVAGIKEGEVYPILELSSDGQWVRLAIDGLAGGGWVSTNFVSVEGILPIKRADSATPAPETPFSLLQPTATPSATSDIVLRPTAIPTDTPTATSTLTATPTATPSATRLVLVIVPTPAPGYATVVTGGSARLRVRAAPDVEAAIVGYAFNGQAYRILEVSSDGEWIRVEGVTEGDAAGTLRDGWLSAQFLTIGQ